MSGRINGIWGVEWMNDFSVLKKLAQDANEKFPALEDQWSMVCTPSVGLDLIAEIERLTQQNRLLTEHNEFLASSDSRLAPELRAVKDALGLDFTASVSGEVVPAIEALRKSDQRYRYLRAKGLSLEGHDFISFDEIADYRIDVAMGKGGK